MPNTPTLPDNAIPLTTYDELDSFASEFAEGAYDLIGVIGHRGLGKSRGFQSALHDQDFVTISGASNPPFQVHQELFRHIDQPIVFDDADTFWADPKARPMLKSLCETTLTGAPRTITYRSKQLDALDIPHSFTTRSKVAVICNTWPKGLDAVADRGIMLHFAPSVDEVHEVIQHAGWFPDPEVCDFIGEHLHLITEPSLRYYIQSYRLKRAKRLDWQDKTLLMIQPNDEKRRHLGLLTALIQNKRLSKMERVARFKVATGLSQATFYRWAEELRLARGGGDGMRNRENNDAVEMEVAGL